jgi:hypothetical protein
LQNAYPDVDDQDPFLLDGNDNDGIGFRMGDDIFDDFNDRNDDDQIPIETDPEQTVKRNE